MSEGKFELAMQHGLAGYFGSVRLVADWTRPTEGVEMEFLVECEPWKAGIRFGIEYAYERIKKAGKPLSGMRVRIVGFRGHEVDTSLMVAAFIAVQAMWQAAGNDEPCPATFVKETGIFSFLK
jgi:hypothetical protein